MKRLTYLQNQFLKPIKQKLAAKGRVTVKMTTGTGKTRTAAKLIKTLEPNAKILWLTHLRDLARDNRQVLEKELNTQIDIIGAGHGFQMPKNRIVVASVQSLSRPNNLQKLNRSHFDYIFVDEAHHAVANTWENILKYFNKAKRIGLTATPFRPDSLPVTSVTGDIAVDFDYNRAVKEKVIAPAKARVVLTESIFDGMIGSNGEFKPQALERLYTSQQRNQLIVDSYLKYARPDLRRNKLPLKTICFCINIKHARRMADLFKKAGISSDILVSNAKYQTPYQRQKALELFKNSLNIEILCVVDVFNEGMDIPDASCALMVRPTRSNIVYQQQLGRVSRKQYYRGKKAIQKKCCIILDFVDNTRRGFRAYSLSNLKGKPPKLNEITVEHLNHVDRKVIDMRIQDVMKNVREFEQSVFSMDIKDWVELCKIFERKQRGDRKALKLWENHQLRKTL